MAQQINLLTPILLAPKRYFSATALVQALGLVLLAGVALSVWMVMQSQQVQAEFQKTQADAAAERQLLIDALGKLPGSADPVVLSQQLAALRQGTVLRQQSLQELQRGRAVPGKSHSDMLRLLAQTVPPSVWLTELRWTAGRLSLEGKTLDTGALQGWMKTLSAHELLSGQKLSAAKVERASDSSNAAALVGSAGARPGPTMAGAGREVWNFLLVSETAPPAPATPASAADKGAAK